MIPKLLPPPWTDSRQNRSFVLQSRTRANLPMAGSSISLKDDSEHNIKAVHSPVHSSKTILGMSTNEESQSFWAEWADEALQEEENRHSSLSSKKHGGSEAGQAKNDQGTHAAESKPEEDSDQSIGLLLDISKIYAIPVSCEKNTIEKDQSITPKSCDEDEVCSLPDASTNTLAVLNISQATMETTQLNESELAADGNGSLLTDLAMQFTAQATECLLAKNYDQAITLFRQAIGSYEKQAAETKSILALVNAASCFRNMSTVSKMTEKFGDATQFMQRALELYVQSLDAVNVKNNEAVLTLDGKLLENSNITAPDASLSCTEEFLCLDTTIVETLQTCADFYIKYQNDKSGAVECHEQALRHLIYLDTLSQWNPVQGRIHRQEGVSFLPIAKNEHTMMLVKSLSELGGYYRVLVRHSTHSINLMLFEDALEILQIRQEEEVSAHGASDNLTFAVASILRNLSEIYFRSHELERAVAALHDSTAVKLTASGEPCAEALEVMEKYGAANESMKNWEKALSCFEQTLFARSKFYGNTHISVATSLVNVARVMEKHMGKSEESADLLRAANAIFALRTRTEHTDVATDMKAILKVIPSVIRHGRYETAAEELEKCLSIAEHASPSNDSLNLDKAQIKFDLGRAYIGMKEYKKATALLIEAVTEAGNSKEEEIFLVLQRVEFLQRSERQDQESPPFLELTSNETFKDPSLRIDDISFQLQVDPSIFFFEDPSPAKHDGQSPNPHHDILYHSFIQDHGQSIPVVSNSCSVPKEQRASIGRTFRERAMSPFRTGEDTNEDETKTHANIRTKISKTMSQSAQRLQKIRERSRKDRAFLSRASCFKKREHGSCRHVDQTRSHALLGAKSDDETIVAQTSRSPTSVIGSVISEITFRIPALVGDIAASARARRPRFRKVVIEQEDSGFSSQIVPVCPREEL